MKEKKQRQEEKGGARSDIAMCLGVRTLFVTLDSLLFSSLVLYLSISLSLSLS
jgi:hypothetical protein